MGIAGIGSKVQKWDACDEQLKSFAHMAVAAQVGCSWCLDFNYFQAHNQNLDLAKAREVPRWRESDVFSPLEREVLAYAEAMTETQPTVTDEMSARCEPARRRSPGRAHGGHRVRQPHHAQNVALGIESDGFADACGLRPLAQPAAIGSSS